jgi:hypothetical protein
MRRVAYLAAALVLAATAAHAKTPGGLVVRYPTDAPGIAALRAAMANPAVSTIVFEKGTHLLVDPDSNLPTALVVFRHNGLTLRGATGRSRDVVIQTAASTAILVEQANGTVLRDLTVRSTAAGGTALRLNSAFSAEVESYADDTTIVGCAFESFLGVQAGVRTRNLTLTGCRATVTQPGGAGILWEDGSGLYLAKNRFTTDIAAAPGVTSTATAAVFVRGPFLPASEGDRARHLRLSRNVVSGDFATGFDLADVTDLRLDGNRIRFPSPQYLDQAPNPDQVKGRVGIVVRRAVASAATEDYRLAGNSVRDAHYALWLLNTGQGAVVSNDFTRCGAPSSDQRFGDTGGAIRLNLQSAVCDFSVLRNDLRRLKSPLLPTNPAVVVVPQGSEAVCFTVEDQAGNPVDLGNRVDRGRLLYLGATKR